MGKPDIVIIGGGIIGLSIAYRLSLRYPDFRIVVLEKEDQLAAHQSGRNSGVLHTGIYYRPGSLKAVLCRRGKRMLEEFCKSESLPFDICGKLIVATSKHDLVNLTKLYSRARKNGVRAEMIEAGRLRMLEPYAIGKKALHVPDAGIVDFPAVCRRLAELLRSQGCVVKTNQRVTGISEVGTERLVITEDAEYQPRFVINCAGLYADRIAESMGITIEARIIPFRGEYYRFTSEAEYLCRNLVYPTPDERFPFLGVHVTRMIGGGIECGPNAVLAFAREGYRRTDVNYVDLAEMATYSGMRRLATKHWRAGCAEFRRSMSKSAFVREVQRLIPLVEEEHLEPAESGVRAQMVRPDGTLADDFIFAENEWTFHVLNAPSPAATSSFAIAEHIVERLKLRLL